MRLFRDWRKADKSDIGDHMLDDSDHLWRKSQVGVWDLVAYGPVAHAIAKGLEDPNEDNQDFGAF
jgi:hypothetical protein